MIMHTYCLLKLYTFYFPGIYILLYALFWAKSFKTSQATRQPSWQSHNKPKETGSAPRLQEQISPFKSDPSPHYTRSLSLRTRQGLDRSQTHHWAHTIHSHTYTQRHFQVSGQTDVCFWTVGGTWSAQGESWTQTLFLCGHRAYHCPTKTDR